ncbi:MAG: hypothetical protein AAF809_04115 [Bacteroidota bacterium]
MGQQQLLLLVLAIAIVGLAVVNVLQEFPHLRNKSEYDKLTMEAFELVADAQAWKQKPQALGGGAGASYLTGLTLNQMGYPQTGSNAKASWATTDDMWRWLARPDTRRPYAQVRSRANTDLMVQVFMYGPGVSCIKSRLLRHNGTRWIGDGTNVATNAVPDGCDGW